MKKFLFILLTFTITSLLVACGGDGKSEKNTTLDDTPIETEFGVFTPLKQLHDIDQTFESDSIELTVKQAQVVTYKPSKEYAEFFEDQDKPQAVLIEMEVVNTGEETAFIYPDQSTLTINDEEEIVDSDLLIANMIGGEFASNIDKEGYVVYFIDTPADDVKEISVHINGTHDENFDTVGDDIEIELEF